MIHTTVETLVGEEGGGGGGGLDSLSTGLNPGMAVRKQCCKSEYRL